MPLPPEFWQKLEQRGDAELHDMLAHPEDYLPEALEAIRAEVVRRNLPIVTASALKEQAKTQKDAEVVTAASTLGWPLRFAVLIGSVPLFLIIFFLVMYYRRTGQRRKVRECGQWFAAGLILYPLLMFFSFVISDSAMRAKFTFGNILNGLAIGAIVTAAFLVLNFLKEFYGGPHDDSQ